MRRQLLVFYSHPGCYFQIPWI